MLIYKKNLFDNQVTLKKASLWLKNNLITKDEYNFISAKYPTPYQESKILVRIGMFLFSLLGISTASSLFFMMFHVSGSISFQLIFLGAALYAIAEYLFSEGNYFRSGITDALLYYGVISFCTGLIIIVDGNNFSFNLDPVIYFSVVFPFLLFSSIRFADSFLTLLAYVCLFVINTLMILKLKTIGQAVLPFESMFLSVLIYNISKKISSNNEFRFWKRPIFMIEIISLIILYASLNYYVIRQLTENFLNITIAPGDDIHLSFLFYCFTILIPLYYLFRGVAQKDYVMIRLGLILEVAGILSIRFYHTIMPAETAMILGGIFLLIISWLGINYLKTPKYGLTFSQMDDEKDFAFSAITSVLISQTGKDLQSSIEKKGDVFGGGSSGGGGAGGEF